MALSQNHENVSTFLILNESRFITNELSDEMGIEKSHLAINHFCTQAKHCAVSCILYGITHTTKNYFVHWMKVCTDARSVKLRLKCVELHSSYNASISNLLLILFLLFPLLFLVSLFLPLGVVSFLFVRLLLRFPLLGGASRLRNAGVGYVVPQYFFKAEKSF